MKKNNQKICIYQNNYLSLENELKNNNSEYYERHVARFALDHDGLFLEL